jgi:hypothetical protein
LAEITPTLVMNALVYVKSSWPVIRGNAAMFIGKVLKGDTSLVIEKKNRIRNTYVNLMCFG